MWFNIKIEIRGGDRAHYNFVSESYDNLSDITTLSLEVFATELITLYSHSGRGYPNFAQFKEDLIENKISLNPLIKFIKFNYSSISWNVNFISPSRNTICFSFLLPTSSTE